VRVFCSLWAQEMDDPPIVEERRIHLPAPPIPSHILAEQLSSVDDEGDALAGELLPPSPGVAGASPSASPAVPVTSSSPVGGWGVEELEGEEAAAEEGPASSAHALFWGVPAELKAAQASAAEAAAKVVAGDVGALLDTLGPLPADAVLATYEGLDTGGLYGAFCAPVSPPQANTYTRPPRSPHPPLQCARKHPRR